MIRRWLVRLATAVALLEAYGERVNPWNIRDVWPLTAPDADSADTGSQPSGGTS